MLLLTPRIALARYGDENFSIALQDSILCFEMPLFALLHLYAFSHRDYLPSETRTFSGRLPFRYAVRDSLLGYKDVLDDSLTTFRGTGFSYRTFEPAEGGLHSNVGDARARRARAGLRYANGGKTKYWLPMPGADVEEAYGRHSAGHAPLGAGGYAGKDTRHRIAEAAGDSQVAAQEVRHGIAEMIVNPIQTLGRKIRERRDADRGYAPIAPEQADEVVHQDPRYVIDRVASRHAEERETTSGLVPFGLNGNGEGGQTLIGRTGESASESSSVRDARLEFGEPDEDEERLYADARQHEFGDYNYPIVDASKEEARRKMRDLEDAFIAGRSRRPDWRTLDPAGMGKRRQSGPQQGKSGKAKGSTVPGRTRNKALQGAVVDLRKGVVDLLVEDKQAEQEEQILERLVRAGQLVQIKSLTLVHADPCRQRRAVAKSRWPKKAIPTDVRNARQLGCPANGGTICALYCKIARDAAHRVRHGTPRARNGAHREARAHCPARGRELDGRAGAGLCSADASPGRSAVRASPRSARRRARRE